MMNSKIATAVEEVKAIQLKHGIERTFVLYSGGNDSGALVAAMMENGLAEAVLHIDTGIGIEETQEHVVKVCADRECPLHIAKTPFSYDDMVLGREKLSGGFPSPGSHLFYYTRLKERALEKFRRENKTRRGERWLLLTGIRQGESVKRMRLKDAYSKTSGFHWYNPMFLWDKADCREAMKAYGIPENPVSTLLGYSGECLCGCNAKSGELEMIETFYPACGRRLRDLHEKAKEAGYWWGWDETAPKGYSKNQEAFDFLKTGEGFSLCQNCMMKGE